MPKRKSKIKTQKSKRPTKKIVSKRKAPDFSFANRVRSAFKGKKVSLPQASRKNKIFASIVVLLLIAGFLAYKNKGLFLAATVNGKPIWRWTILTDSEKQTCGSGILCGKEALNNEVAKTLVLDEANRRNISVSQSQVDAEVKKAQSQLAAQGQTLNQYLASQGMTRSTFEENIKIQKTLEKMFGSSVNVSDKEVDAYINANKDQLPQGTNMDQYRAGVISQLKQQKLSEKVQQLLQDLQKKAKINFFVSY